MDKKDNNTHLEFIKKNKIWFVIGAIIGLTIFIYDMTKETTEKEITIEDPLDIEVTKTHYSHGALSFNDSVYIVSACFFDKDIELDDIEDLDFPFFIKKKANNDTLRVITKDKEYILIYWH